ncbi:hypothetical protein CSO01_35980 [Cellulomonas soli]|uniref:HTH luxR-type domain-containing protein n=1 Tax=Cellulomonas soli TaxID=931535 RepID=A0A512PI77_9CELL|nr:hypothetical protein CSO01_35980 [Cellulomonas soli]
MDARVRDTARREQELHCASEVAQEEETPFRNSMPILGVKWQVRSIYCKFGVSTRAEAVAHGRRVGLIAD